MIKRKEEVLKIKNYFGMSLWDETLNPNDLWLQSFNIEGEFSLDKSGWSKLFIFLVNILKESNLVGKTGGCYHFTTKIPEFVIKSGSQIEFVTSLENFRTKYNIPLAFGMHCSFLDVDMPLGPKYHETLKHDILLCKAILGEVIAQHPPENQEDCIDQLVNQITSKEIIDILKDQKITLCWENIVSPHKKNLFFSSLKNLVDFHYRLTDKLKDIGLYKNFKNTHQYCLDTGHLLLWRDQNPHGINFANREIDEYLPIFAKNIKIFHIHVNDGMIDSHFIPYSDNNFDNFNNSDVNREKIEIYSDDITNWLQICHENRGKHIDSMHWHIENLSLPFSKPKIVEFGRKLRFLIK